MFLTANWQRYKIVISCVLQPSLLLLSRTISFWCNLTNNGYNSSSNYNCLIMSNDRGAKTNSGVSRQCEWRPEDIIAPPHKIGNGHVCLVLNRMIRIPPHAVTELWQNAKSRCCVDGGSNRWLQFLKDHNDLECKLKPPDLITGDFDSITEETREFFNSNETRYIHTPDQNATDFSKAVQIINPILEQEHIQDIIVFHDTSGRFDQIMANINTIYRHEQAFFNIHLLSGTSLTWLLKPGKHSITIPIELLKEQRWCSLIPIGQEATITTKGLKWNLTNHCCKFGGMVSTSNTYASTFVEVETDTSLIWSMGIFDFSDD